MQFDINSGIFIGFLIANLLLGLSSSRGITSVKEYAVGDRNFSTATIVATIVATWVSGEFFYTIIAESYSKGLYFIWVVVISDPLCLLLIGLFFAPRMAEFLGKLSIAEAMGDMFGEKVRIITAISSFIGVSGIIAIQLKIAAFVFEYVGIPNVYGILIAGVIVTIYSSLGGIKSVTFTDVIQFITFCAVIPIVAYILLNSVNNTNAITDTLLNNPLFDHKKVFDFSDSNNFHYLLLFFWSAIPAFNPAFFQRVSMAKDVNQVRNSFCIASVTCFILVLLVCWIAILMLANHPNADANNVINNLISDIDFIPGLKGLLLSGIMAMILSTIDSYINSTAVIVVNDFCKPLGIKLFDNRLLFTRVISMIIGAASIFMCIMNNGTALELFLFASSFYMPVVSVPFIMAVFGFRSSGKSVIIGMAAGISTVLMWDYVLKIKVGNSVPAGMLVNLIVLMGSHYLLKQPGGWVGIKDKRELIKIRKGRKRLLGQLWSDIKSFNLIEVYKNNYPEGDGLISILGFYVMLSVFATTNLLPEEYRLQHLDLLDIFYPIAVSSSAILISYPLWLWNWKESRFVGVFWNLIMFWVLICFTFLTVLIGRFSEMQLIVFMMNIVIISSLGKWQWSLFNFIAGIVLVSVFYTNYYPGNLDNVEFASSQFKIFYLLILLISTLILFLKPKQEYQELTEEKNEHLNGRINMYKEQAREAEALKGRFIRNITHEYHAPMTGISSMAQVLVQDYDKLNDEQRKIAAKTILDSSLRLEVFDANISSLSKLNKPSYDLKLAPTNFSQLVEDRVTLCRKLYENEEERTINRQAGRESSGRNWQLDIEEGIVLSIDKYYMSQALDNLIINSINYAKSGTIGINLKQDKDKEAIVFSISDEGIGIPPDELDEVFEEFIVSSRTQSFAGGRGVGLAVCKKVIEVHGGAIKAESKKIGTTIWFTLPKAIKSR
ncbi:MAG: ATP-binding protein [Rickettsiaceae bacterium]|nr:ATP-binding protein [Rickettsiaceae bacterium]